MAREATSIYIDNSSIRVLTLRGKQAQKWGTIPLEPGLVKDGVIIDKDTVTSKIKELWRKEKIGSHRVIAGINGINCFYRFLSLPELPRNLLDEAAMREARRALGVPVEQLHLSWQVLPSPKGETRIYLVAAQRSSVDTLISVLRRAGLTPYLMDLAPLGLARTTTEPRAIMVDLQPRNLDIVVRIEGIPEVIRSVPLSREAVLEEKVPIVRDEVHRAITFYNSSHADKPIDTEVPLLVCGELAEREDVWKLVTGRQKRPVQVLPPPVEDVKDFSACRYMINIGLAFKEVLGSRKEASAYLQVNFNALPQTYIPKRHPISDLFFIPITIAGIALVAFGFYVCMPLTDQTSDLRAELASTQQMNISKTAEVKTLTEEIEALAAQVPPAEETVNTLSTTLDDFNATRDEINTDLAKINDGLQIGAVDLLGLNDNTETITINGTGADAKSIFSYASFLRASGRFDLVVITAMHEDEPRIAFTLTLTKPIPVTSQ